MIINICFSQLKLLSNVDFGVFNGKALEYLNKPLMVSLHFSHDTEN